MKEHFHSSFYEKNQIIGAFTFVLKRLFYFCFILTSCFNLKRLKKACGSLEKYTGFYAK